MSFYHCGCNNKGGGRADGSIAVVAMVAAATMAAAAAVTGMVAEAAMAAASGTVAAGVRICTSIPAIRFIAWPSPLSFEHTHTCAPWAGWEKGGEICGGSSNGGSTVVPTAMMAVMVAVHGSNNCGGGNDSGGGSDSSSRNGRVQMVKCLYVSA